MAASRDKSGYKKKKGDSWQEYDRQVAKAQRERGEEGKGEISDAQAWLDRMKALEALGIDGVTIIISIDIDEANLKARKKGGKNKR